MTGTTGAIAWFTSWIVLLAILWGIAKTEVGGKVTYYVTWLAVLLLLLLHYKDIASLINPQALLQGQQ